MIPKRRLIGPGAPLGPDKTHCSNFSLRFALESGLTNSGADTDSDPANLGTRAERTIYSARD